ncbi:MAG: choice-of-anchor Q domain-containing protein, partial [Kiritimatiellae bacterium]|nr:choice-of-anchor Q domain-containing protein [Kiritimatiellia bacterium]
PGTPGICSIGQYGGGGYRFVGAMDEVTVSTVARSADWVWANWMNQASNDLFVSFFSMADLSCDFTVSPSAGYRPFTPMFAAIVHGTNTTGLYYRWDFDNDGTIDTEGTDKGMTTHTYTTCGVYAASVSVSNSAGETACCTNLNCVTVNETWHVALSGDHTTFLDWATAATNIQAAVDRANHGDRIKVAAGAYDLTNQIVIGKRVLVEAVDGRDATFLVGGYPACTNRCLLLNHAEAVVDGFTITNGFNADAWPTVGGGVMISNGTLRNCTVTRNNIPNASGAGIGMTAGLVRDCVISHNGNIGCNGAGAVYVSGNGTVSNCTIVHNQVTSFCGYHGGVAMGTGSLLADCLVSNNAVNGYIGGVGLTGGMAINCEIVNNWCAGWTGSGGGIDLGSGAVASNCVIRGNYGGAGGIRLNGGAAPARAYNCVISGNNGYWANDGRGAGGVKMGDNTLLQNCLVSGNEGYKWVVENPDSAIGGVYVSGSANIDIKSCTIAGNSCTGTNGGFGDLNNAARVVNTIIYDNHSDAGVGDNWYTWAPAGGDLANCTYSCSTPAVPGAGNVSANPEFKHTAAQDYRLKGSSPCVDAGYNETWMATALDLDGRPRVVRSRVDMGAYEVETARGTGVVVR